MGRGKSTTGGAGRVLPSSSSVKLGLSDPPPFVRPMPRALYLVLAAGVTAGVAAGCASAPPASAPGPTAPPAATIAAPRPPGRQAALAADGALARAEISPGEEHVYRLDVPPGHWVSIELRQRQADLDLHLVDASGRTVAGAATNGNWRPEILDAITADGGPYRVRVTVAAGAERGGGYSLRLAEVRPVRPDDPARVEARAALRRAGAAGGDDAAARLAALRDAPPVAWTADEAAAIGLALGDALYAAKRTAEAEAAYRTGLEALPQPPSGVVAAELQRGLGHAARQEKRPEDARRHFRAAVELARAAGDPATLGSALDSEGRLLYWQGELDAAAERFAEAVAAKQVAGDLPGEVRSRANLSLVHSRRGERRAAYEEQERAERLAREAGAEPRLRFSLLRMLAVFHRTFGEVDRALVAFEEALGLAVADGDASGETSVRVHLGSLLTQLGDYPLARTHLGRAIELATAAGDDDYRARALLSLGWTEIGLGDADAAVARLEQALALVAHDDHHHGIALLHALGTAETLRGRRAAAEVHLLRALERARERRMHREVVDLERALGNLHLESGALADATAALQRSLDGATLIADPLRSAAATSLLARAASRRGEPAAALAHALEAIRLREEVRSRLADPSLRASFLARWRADFDLAIEMLMHLARVEPGDERLRQAFRLSEDAHARTLSELLAEARVEVRRGISEPLLDAEREAERRLSRVQSELTDALAEPAEAARLEELEAERREAQAQVEAVEVEIHRAHRGYAGIRYPRAPSVEQVQARLPPGTALLEYALGEGASALFVVTRERFAALPLASVEEVALHVGRVRELIRSPLGGAVLRRELASLSRLLLAPAAAHLEGVDRLLIVPDRDLFYLPFEALPVPGDAAGEPGGVLRRWMVTYLPSAAVLEQLADATPQTWVNDVLLFADPPALVAGAAAERGATSRLGPPGGLPPLPGARREAERIAALFPRADLRLGAEARESLIKNAAALPAARRLHIASHGWIDEREPASSFVLLAADEEAGDDGLLQIHEVFNLDLSAELVVLSGCETALGQRIDGEGLLGLARAFLYAGARDLVVSLWPVSDHATGELMVAFYRQLAAGRPPAEALRHAKLAGLGSFAAADWAAFVLFAPPEPGASE